VAKIDLAVEHDDPLSGFILAFVGWNGKSLVALHCGRAHRHRFQWTAGTKGNHMSTFGMSYQEKMALSKPNV
jgi:hypothetical protein